MYSVYTVEIDGKEVTGDVELYANTDLSGRNGGFDSFANWEVIQFNSGDAKLDESILNYLQNDGFNDLLAYLEEQSCTL